MKKVLKILLPILLALAVVVSIGWYFLKYDPGMTRDLLVSQARRLESRGNHSMATWFYNLAYRQSDEDESVAIELAQQYKTSGNYTKAEYTLTNAIKSGGSAELYIALCKTYVEQDKLLDAVTMLNNVADPDIKAQLDELRPAAPVPNRESGYYNEYISISFTAEGGDAYVTTDGVYPSLKNKPLTEPVVLSGGVTTIYALTVAENGLVSPLSVLDYTVAGVVEPVELTDEAMELAVRELLQVSPEHTLYSDELWEITKLDVPSDAATLSDLSWMPFLQELTIRNSGAESLSALSSLSNLETLTVTGTNVSAQDLQIIANLPKLTQLTLSDCGISGISELSGAANLTVLDLHNNSIRDLTALATMPYLQTVDLSHNALASVEVLGALTNLTSLDVSYNSITSTAPLATCAHLTKLNLTSNLLTGLNGMEQLVSLVDLSAGSNKLTDISSLSACVALETLNLSNNGLTDVSPLASLNALVDLDLSYNQISALPAFTENCKLVTIDASHNQLTTLAPLSVLSRLNYVTMDYNSGLTSLSPLKNCEQLVEVSVYGTAITDVSVLTGNNSHITVNYSPI